MEMDMDKMMMNADTMALRTGRGLDAAEHRQLLKAGDEAEDRRHTRGDEAEHEGTRRKLR